MLPKPAVPVWRPTRSWISKKGWIPILNGLLSAGYKQTFTPRTFMQWPLLVGVGVGVGVGSGDGAGADEVAELGCGVGAGLAEVDELGLGEGLAEG